MREKILTTAVLFILSAQILTAQKKIVFEGVRYATSINYLEDKNHQKLILQYLDAALQKNFNAQLSEVDSIRLINIHSPEANLTANHLSNDTSCRHLVINIIEHKTANFFNTYMDISDSVLRRTTKVVFQVSAQVFGHDEKVTFDNVIDVFAGHAKGPGIGFASTQLMVLPKSFAEILRIGFNNLFDIENGMAQLTVKVLPVYIADNFITPSIQNVTRIIVDTVKNISAYRYNGERQMLRQGGPFYEEMILRGRKALPYTAEIRNAVNETENISGSDYVCLQQEGRDVLANKDYLLKIYTQINPEMPVFVKELLFTNFLPGQIHTLLNDKDTIAKFSIRKNIREIEKKIFPGRVYNGVDTATMVKISSNAGFSYPYSYLVKGILAGSEFTIKCSDIKSVVKEIYYKGKLVCIAQGVFRPEVFAVFDASLSPEILNQLFLIGFNRFFE